MYYYKKLGGCYPIPWRRAYSFAQNSQLLNRGFDNNKQSHVVCEN